MNRYPDWSLRLEAFIDCHKDAPFEYGVWDCCLFACDAIEAITGVDTAVEFRGRYHSRSEAIQAIRERVGSASVRKLAESVTAAYGMQKVSVLNARRGDLVLIKRPRDYSLGIVALNGLEVIVLMASGFQFIELSQAFSSWRV